MGLTAMTISRRRWWGLAVPAALALSALSGAPAAAQSSAAKPSFSLTAAQSATGALRLLGAPGDQLRGAVRVQNVTGKRVTVLLQPADIRTASNGNADYVTRDPAQAGRWLTLDATRVTLAAGAARRVAFDVAVPATARGASHYAGVVGLDEAEMAKPAARQAKRGRSFRFPRINRQAVPITIRLPGPLSRSLALRSVKLDVQPVGAGLVLALQPGGTELIDDAQIDLRVQRGSEAVFSHTAKLGQLFPGSNLAYRIPWKGRPTEGSYRVVGMIQPRDAAAVPIDQTVVFAPEGVAELDRETTPATAPATEGLPLWVWIVIALAGALVAGLSVAVWRLARRRNGPTAARGA